MVVALVAVIATGLSVNYSGIRKKASEQIVLKDMVLVRDAFKVFYSDNYNQIRKLKGKDSEGNLLDYFQDYGLWGLLQRKVDSFEFRSFDSLSGEGWCGPYIENSARDEKEIEGNIYPQPTDLNNNRYELLKVEFSDSMTDYRRLLLVFTTDGILDLDTESARKRIDLKTGKVAFSGNENDFTVELLNLDQYN